MTRTFGVLLAVSVLLVGCGDEGGSAPDGGGVPDAGGGEPDGGDCVGDFDIAGTYEERYSCDSVVGDGVCGEMDVSSTITIVAKEGTDNQYTFSSGGTWNGEGILCGSTFTWEAEDTNYTETGTWEFSDAMTFTKTSTYTPNDGSASGDCTGAASQGGTPEAPAPVGDCT